MTAIQTNNAWFKSFELVDGEAIILSYPSNHSQGKRAVGGKLFVTTHRIVFAPNQLDANLGGRALEVALPQVTSIATVPPRFRIEELFSGALRTRLAINTGKDQVDFFVVAQPNTVARQIADQVRGGSSIEPHHDVQ